MLGNKLIQETQFYDKYSRWNEEQGRRETWEETVERVWEFFYSHTPLGKVDPIDMHELYAAFYNKEVLPAMRIIQMAGPSLERCHVGAYNCCYTPVESFKDIADILYILMQGTGVGFSVEQKYVGNLPLIQGPKGTAIKTYIVDDSTEGWANSVHAALDYAQQGKALMFDYSRIRPKGTRLKTKGGLASGPEPLQRLHEFIHVTFENRRNAGFLRPIDVYDIVCMTGYIVEVGGVRRAALMCLYDLEDHAMRDAKQGEFWNEHPQRSRSNNSAVYNTLTPDANFSENFKALRTNGTGEPGIFNRAVANTIYGTRDVEYGTNPCLTGDTIIATVAGPRTFKQLADDGKDTLVYAWHPETKVPVIRWMRRPHMTQQNADVLEVEFDSGLKVRCTPDHHFYTFRGRKLAAKNLTIGQSIRAWSMSQHRDGQFRVHGWDSSTNRANHQWVHRMLWENANGPIPEGMVLHHIDGNNQNNDLTNLQIVDPIEHNRIHYPQRLANGFDGHAPNHKIVGIRKAGTADVYNGCVDDAHTYIVLDPEAICGIQSGIVSANCGEIILRPRQFCNLSIAVARKGDTKEDLKQKVKLAAIFGTLQATLTDFTYINEKFKENCEKERLLGVDINGQLDNELFAEIFRDSPFRNDGVWGDELEVLSQFADVAYEANATYAEKFGINKARAYTTVKPSGNSAQFLDCASGLHPRFSPFYIRRLRIGADSPVAKVLEELGVPGEMGIGETTIKVFDFPVKSPEGSVTRHESTAIKQLKYWTYMTAYTNHNPSCTVYVKPEEWEHVEQFVRDFFSDINGISFLPYDGGVYQQAPYEEITEAQYDTLVAAMPENVDWPTLLKKYEQTDTTTSAREVACVGGICDI